MPDEWGAFFTDYRFTLNHLDLKEVRVRMVNSIGYGNFQICFFIKRTPPSSLTAGSQNEASKKNSPSR
jgi:hypothetical protein